MKMPAFIVGILLLFFSIVLYFFNDNLVSQAVSTSTETVLSLIFPMFLIGGFIFTFYGIGGD